MTKKELKQFIAECIKEDLRDDHTTTETEKDVVYYTDKSNGKTYGYDIVLYHHYYDHEYERTSIEDVTPMKDTDTPEIDELPKSTQRDIYLAIKDKIN